MIRAVAYQKIEMSDQEFEYYKELVKQFSEDNIKGDEYFKDLFKSDDRGFVTIIKPMKPVPMMIMHFIQQVQINQRLRSNDDTIEKLTKEINNLKNKMGLK